MAAAKDPVHEVEFLRDEQSPTGTPMVVGYTQIKHKRDRFRLAEFRIEMSEALYHEYRSHSGGSVEKLYDLVKPSAKEMEAQRPAMIAELQTQIDKAKLSLENNPHTHKMWLDLWQWTVEAGERGIKQLKETMDSRDGIRKPTLTPPSMA